MLHRHRLLAIGSLRVAVLLTGACAGGGAPPAQVPAQAAAAKPAGDATRRKQLFTQSCSACHAPDAKGLPGQRPD